MRIGRARQGQDAQAGRPARRRHADDGSGFSTALLDDAEAVLKRAGERLRLSGNHTVVALAGGTGSGKSTLFNALSGATFSPPGVTRPMTGTCTRACGGCRAPPRCSTGSGVQRRHRYARASVLDSGESDLDGLILLDLPDHDSVVTASMAAVDRLSKLADMVIWVLDPQKYADAAVHNRYLIPLAGHAAVFTVVLNQIDVLSPAAGQGLRGGPAPPARRRGPARRPGLPGLGAHRRRPRRAARAAHRDGAQNRAVTDRIAADIDAMIGGFAVYDGPQVAPDTAAGRGRRGAARRAAAGSGRRPAEGAVPAAVGPDRGRASEAAAIPAPAASRPPWEDATPDGGKRDGRRPGRQRPEGGGGQAHRRVRAAPRA